MGDAPLRVPQYDRAEEFHVGMIGTLVPASMDEVERYGASETGYPDPFQSRDAVSLEKMWHALHFLFTGNEGAMTEEPLSRAIFGGTSVGPERGYGSARVLSPADVRAIAEALAVTEFAEIWKRFDASRMTELGIYPVVWDEGEEELRAEIKAYFDELVACYAAAAKAEKAMLLDIS